jgi:hypothetical protein
MTKVIRFVPDPDLWEAAYADRDDALEARVLVDLNTEDVIVPFDDAASKVPVFFLRSFTPSDREKGKLSLYRLEDGADPAELASAWWLIEKIKFAMIAVDAIELTGSSFILTDEPGDTYHTNVNPKHTDLSVFSGEDALAISRIFFEKGELIPFTDKDIFLRIANDNEDGKIEFTKLCKKKNQNSVNKMSDLISGNILKLTKP